MDFLNSPIFVLISFIVVGLGINFLPYSVALANTLFWKMWFPIIITILFVLYVIIVPWTMTNQFFFIFVVVFGISYIHFCFVIKRKVNPILYRIIFIIMSSIFVLWTTTMFGKYYFDNGLFDSSDYLLRYKEILNENDWFPVTDCKLSIMFFDISFRNYFILPDDISFKNPFFVQFLLGIIISGTIISWVIDMIKSFITPSAHN